MLLLVVVLTGCAGPEDVEIADYTLRLRPVVPTNQDPFAGLDRVDLVVQPDAGSAVRTTLDVFASGATPVSDGLPALDNAVVYVEGFVGEDVAAWGRTEALQVSTGDVESTVLVAATDAPAWLGPLGNPLAGAMLASLGAGRFFLGGGINEGSGTTLSQTNDTFLLLDLAPATDALAFVESGTLPIYQDAYDGDELRARTGATLTPVSTGPFAGQFLLVGGASGPGWEHGDDVTRDVELYDAVAGTWTPVRESDQLATPRTEHLVTTNAQGAVLVAGGWTTADPGTFAWTPTIELWDPATGAFSVAQTDTRLGSLDLVTADLGVDGTLVCGGAYFDVSDGRWSSTEHCAQVGLDGLVRDGPDLPAALTGSAMVTLPDGRILLTGGVTQESRTDLDVFPGPDARTSAWVYVGQGTWQSVSPMSLPRAGHRMALLSDGRVLVAGGAPTYSPVRTPTDAYSCLEVFDPDANTFTLLADCGGEDAALGLAGRAWKPAVVVDPEFGALVVGGANATDAGEEAASQVTLYTPEHTP